MMNNEIIKFLQSKQIPQCGDKVYTADEKYEAYQRAIDAVEQTTWIPVSERLPEEDGEYLITWKNPKYPKTYIGICECEITDVYDHEHNGFEVEWLFDGYITTAYPDSYVVAWQPLPEPYQKGGKE